MSEETPIETILFVDDEAEVLEILRQTFEDDYRVLTASGGEEALALLSREKVELLVSDQRMPKMTGIQLIEQARERAPELLCILLTAYTDPPDLIDAINRGQVYRYVTKPWEIQDLMMTVRSALDAVKLRRENAQLLVEARSRLSALEVLYEVSRAAGTGASYREVVDQVSGFLPRVVDHVLSGTLLRVRAGEQAVMTLRCQAPASEGQLQRLKTELLDQFATLTGATLSEDEVLVRITGRQTAEGGEALDEALEGRHFLPLRSEGRPTGVLGVVFAGADPLNADDTRVLDILANQIAESITLLRRRHDKDRHRLQRMVDGMADGLIMTDPAGEVVVVNDAAARLLGVGERAGIDATFLRDHLGFYPFELIRGWEKRGVRDVSEDLVVEDRVLHSVVSPVLDEEAGLTGVVVALRDVTAARALEQRKQEFVSIISHELRTPLTSLSGSIDLILNRLVGDITEKQDRYLTLAKGSAERLNRIVDDLLDLGKFAAGKVQLELGVLMLDEVVREAVERYEGAFIKEQLEVRLRLPSSPMRVLADRDRLDQVLNNLLTNAVKFTPAEGNIEVEVFADADVAQTAGFSVWNSGEPIPGDEIDKIFEQFERSRNSKRIRGTGLGLPICRQLVEAHGGKVWAENTGRGARFVVTLPLGAMEQQADQSEEKDPWPSGEGRILVVDDDRPAAYAMKGLLLSGGYSVEVAHRAEEALSLARRRKPTLVVVDVHMPDIDGVRLTEILRHDPETRGVPILAISGADERERAIHAGANGFMAKPLQPRRFLDVIGGLVCGPREGMRVLVVDDDAGIRALCRETLEGSGYRVAEADSVQESIAQVASFRPDLLVLDINLQDGEGFEVLERLKAERSTALTSVIFLSARDGTADKVRALQLGGDDYMVKPFDTKELAARVDTALRRRELELTASPTTRLPGGIAIERAVQRCLDSKTPFALCYIDIDNLKAFNDYYGYAKADGVILQTGDLLVEAVSRYGKEDDFVGHIAGDDFVIITHPDRAEAVCRAVIEAFDRIIPLYYGGDDRRRGFIETDDRFGNLRQFPVMSVSIVAVPDPGGRFTEHAEIASRAARLKKQAKASEGSVYLLDSGESPEKT